MVVIGKKTFLIAKLKEKLKTHEGSNCAKEVDAYFACLKHNTWKTSMCVGYLARYEMCMVRGDRANVKLNRSHTNFGYKINELAKLASRSKLR